MGNGSSGGIKNSVLGKPRLLKLLVYDEIAVRHRLAPGREVLEPVVRPYLPVQVKAMLINPPGKKRVIAALPREVAIS